MQQWNVVKTGSFDEGLKLSEVPVPDKIQDNQVLVRSKSGPNTCLIIALKHQFSAWCVAQLS